MGYEEEVWMDYNEDGIEPVSKSPTVIKIANIIESPTYEKSIILLLIFDVIFVMGEILIEFIHLGEKKCPDLLEPTFLSPEDNLPKKKPKGTLYNIEKFCYVASVTILVIFVIENLVKMAVFGPKYYSKLKNALDFALILTSLAISLFLHGISESLVALLVILRFWRVIHVIKSGKKLLGKKEMKNLEAKELEWESQLEIYRSQIHHLTLRLSRYEKV
ncbi:hypothetical protein BC833DRAFT_616396 [Globomyces pollinis-pini]|nr:hypothetical protein BC833DRAFT_616396 [Globomyces pollinis-pini]